MKKTIETETKIGYELPQPRHTAGASPPFPAMLYLIAIFCSPLALLLAGKPISAIFNLILYVISIVLWVTIILWQRGFSALAARDAPRDVLDP